LKRYIEFFSAANIKLPTLKERPKRKFLLAGYWKNHKYIPLIKKDGRAYALFGWDGEKYVDSWRYYGDHNIETNESFTITPIYTQLDDGSLEITDYDIRKTRLNKKTQVLARVFSMSYRCFVWLLSPIRYNLNTLFYLTGIIR
jgi:hypothetical protein